MTVTILAKAYVQEPVKETVRPVVIMRVGMIALGRVVKHVGACALVPHKG